jgi:SpoVK/Ycf46/Vps4 family AAA+-type ATPase
MDFPILEVTDKKNNKKRYNQFNDTTNKEPSFKKSSTYINYYDDDDDDDDGGYIPSIHAKIEEAIPEEEKELVEIDREINTLNDLIELGKMYDTTKRYNIDLKILSKLVESLTELNNMIGMESVKQDIVDHILFRIQNFDTKNQDMMHTVIQGPPGVGKTEVARIIGKVYLAMGILNNDKFIKATRSNLIGEYLGHTAKQTQRVINSAEGGILFIDEVYSLGNTEKRDSFSKECIDTINENLTEKKTNFICIIAGYKKEIDSCFFSYNPGLERRFPIRFTIENYTANELFLIFKKKVKDMEWSLAEGVNEKFFIDNYEHFKYFGGDMEVLFSRTKRAHARRVFASKNSIKKEINMTDIARGFDSFKAHKKVKEESEFWKTMFM